VYQCTASNGVGEPVTQNISLNVLCKWYVFTCRNMFTVEMLLPVFYSSLQPF
jgi:hypothetical protein